MMLVESSDPPDGKGWHQSYKQGYLDRILRVGRVSLDGRKCGLGEGGRTARRDVGWVKDGVLAQPFTSVT